MAVGIVQEATGQLQRWRQLNTAWYAPNICVVFATNAVVV
jgi:hypothetical protein